MVQLEILIVGLVFLAIGFLQVSKPEIYIKFARWQMKKIWKADLKYNKHTEQRIRFVGAIFIVIGLLVLYSHLILGQT